jgi:hypothetical protein
MMKEIVSLQFPLTNDIMTTLRLTTGGVCSLVGLNLDDSEDCKLCLTEGLLVLLRNGYQSAEIRFCEEDGLSVTLSGVSRGEATSSAEDEISYALLSALVADLQIEREKDSVRAISFRFGC